MKKIQNGRKKLTFLILATIAVVVFLSGIFYYQIDITQYNEEKKGLKETVRFGLPTSPIHALSIIAKEQGFFSQAGLEVIITEYPSGKRALKEGLFSGHVDIVGCATGPVVFFSFTRKDFKVISSVFYSDDIVRIVAHKDSGINQPEDLVGKRIATQKASAVHYFLHLFLLNYNISEEQVQLSFKKAEKLLPSLINREIDAFSLREPFISRAKKQLKGKAVIFAEPGIYRFAASIVASNNLIENKPEVIKKIISALVQAEDYVRKHPALSMKIVSTNLGTSVSEIAGLWQGFDLRVSLEQSFLLNLEAEAKWVIEQRFIENAKSPNYLDFIYLDGLKAIKPDSISIIH